MIIVLQKVFNTQWDKVMPVLYFIFKNFNCYSTEFMRFLFLHRSFLDHLTFTTKSVVCTQIHVHTVHHKTCYYSYIDIKAKESLKKVISPSLLLLPLITLVVET